MAQAKIYWELDMYQQVNVLTLILLLELIWIYFTLFLNYLGGKNIQKISRVLQRKRYLETKCCTCLVYGKMYFEILYDIAIQLILYIRLETE